MHRLLLLSCIAAISLGSGPVAAGTDPSVMTDDEFIEWLASSDPGREVDRRRLAKALFSLTAALEADKSSVRLLQGQVELQESSSRAVHSALESRYAEYLDTLEALRENVSGLLDEPASLLRFYRVLVGGQRACWLLDRHNALIDAYGSGGTDRLAVLSSREACMRLRTLLFLPRVEAIIRDALVERVFQQQEIEGLERQLRDLEDLLADLRQIDAGG